LFKRFLWGHAHWPVLLGKTRDQTLRDVYSWYTGAIEKLEKENPNETTRNIRRVTFGLSRRRSDALEECRSGWESLNKALRSAECRRAGLKIGIQRHFWYTAMEDNVILGEYDSSGLERACCYRILAHALELCMRKFNDRGKCGCRQQAPLAKKTGFRVLWLLIRLKVRGLLHRRYFQFMLALLEKTRSDSPEDVTLTIEPSEFWDVFGDGGCGYRNVTQEELSITLKELLRDFPPSVLRAPADRRCWTCKQDVGARESLCPGCRMARYCSEKCQKEDWRGHKLDCKSMRNKFSSRQRDLYARISEDTLPPGRYFTVEQALDREFRVTR